MKGLWDHAGHLCPWEWGAKGSSARPELLLTAGLGGVSPGAVTALYFQPGSWRGGNCSG